MPWYPDTSANYHITPDLANLSIAHDYNGHDQLHVGNGQGLKITHTSITSLPLSSSSLSLKNVLCVPQIVKNLLLVQKFATDNSCFFEFWPSYFLVKDQVSKKILL